MSFGKRVAPPSDGYARRRMRLERGIGVVLWILLAAVVFVVI